MIIGYLIVWLSLVGENRKSIAKVKSFDDTRAACAFVRKLEKDEICWAAYAVSMGGGIPFIYNSGISPIVLICEGAKAP